MFSVVLTQVIFYGLPWLQWNNRQAVLFDLAARKFYIFGWLFWPQDFIYLTVLLVISALSLFLFTAVAGRLWCGYACPQTVYTEMFMWIERKIEGDRLKRMKLDAEPWSSHKVLTKGAKHAAWIALALWTGFTFVGYFTPIRELWRERSRRSRSDPRRRSGFSSTASQPMAMPVGCASRCASTCVRTLVSRASCSTATR